MKHFECTKLRAARGLVGQIKVEIPADFAPAKADQGQLAAEIKRRFSNLEQLMLNLPVCPCPGHEERAYDCPNRANAHDTLNWAANGVAALAYQEWASRLDRGSA